MTHEKIGIALLLVAYTCQSAECEILVWDFSINEQAIRNGPEEDGSTNSPGLGEGIVSLDSETNILSYEFSWTGLVGDLTKLHIHGPSSPDSSNPQHIVEIFGPPEIPAQVAGTSGTVADSFELQMLEQVGFDPISPSYIIDTLVSGQAYLNVHTTVFGMGEIRGNLGTPVSVPEPKGLGLCAAVVICLFGFKRRMLL